MRLGIIANINRPDAESVTNRVISWCEKNGHEYKLCSDLKKQAQSPDKVCRCEELPRFCDLIISMGGDGTLLAAARVIGKSEVPILGINLGSLGFLTQVISDEVEVSLDRINEKKHKIEKRMVLEAYVEGTESIPHSFALNDVVVDRGDVTRLVELNLYVNDEYISTFFADGLIICTPTGSTAYNAAVGGPILNPSLQVIVAAPMAPQSFAARPLLFGAEDKIRIQLTSKHESGLMTVDGQVSVPLVSGDQIHICRARHSTNLVVFPENSFYRILRTKLNWAVPHQTGS